jgi:hypothetical protein
MDEWPDEKKERIAEVIRSLPLPPRGSKGGVFLTTCEGKSW